LAGLIGSRGRMDMLELLAKARPEARRRIAAIGTNQWDLPTPCTEWRVRDIVNHLILGEVTAPLFLENEPLEGLEESIELAGEDPLGAWDRYSVNATEALSRPGALDAVVMHPFAGEMPGSQLARFRIVDNVLHSWDIAVAIGADPRIDPGITEPLFELTAPLHDVIPRGPLFHAALDVGADAHIQEKLLALFGRDAAWAPPSAGTGVSGSRTGDGEP
jgi:uncharacterized protein (TIGR03086 family)